MARILVCEDSRTQALRVRMILESVGHEVVVAIDGQHALGVLATEAFDLILSDVQMPGLSGFDLCKRIRQDPMLADKPVILMTTLKDLHDFRQGQQVGANTYICKPFEPDDLLRRLDKYLPEDQRGTNALQIPDDVARVAPVHVDPRRPSPSQRADSAPLHRQVPPRAPSPASPSPPPPQFLVPSALASSPSSATTTPAPPGRAVPPTVHRPAGETPAPGSTALRYPPSGGSAPPTALHYPPSAPPAPVRPPIASSPSFASGPAASPASAASAGEARSPREQLSQYLATIVSLTEQALIQSSDMGLRDLLLAIHQVAQKASELPLGEAMKEAEPAWPETSAPEVPLDSIVPPPPALPTEAPLTMLLLVCPADSLRRILQSALERHGFRVLAAGQVAEATRLCRDMGEQIEVLITEATEANHALVETLHRLNPSAHLLYLVDQKDVGSPSAPPLPAGAATLQKPFTANTLLRKVLELLGRPMP